MRMNKKKEDQNKERKETERVKVGSQSTTFGFDLFLHHLFFFGSFGGGGGENEGGSIKEQGEDGRTVKECVWRRKREEGEERYVPLCTLLS